MAKSVDWYYHRTSCNTCARSHQFLAARRVAIGETTSANKLRYGRAGAIAIGRKSEEIVSMRGTKVVRVRLADRPTDDELAAVLLGPHGNLRAPALRVGGTLVIGFDEEVYRSIVG